MRTFLAVFFLMLPVAAGAAVNLQTCTVTPTSGGVAGCPTANLAFAPVSPSSWVRSVVNGTQAFRPFSTLKPADTVWTGSWQPLSAITPALQPSTPVPAPVVVPPAPSLTQDVLITLVGGTAPQSVVFSGVSVPACFAIGPAPAKQVCLP